MTDMQEDFTLLLRRAREGCPLAAREMYDRYSPHIRRVVRRQLCQRLRTQYDSHDFLQAVWASFFTGPWDRLEFDGPEQLVGFLCSVAYNKVVDAFRQRLQTQKHALNRERSLDNLAEEKGVQPAARTPSPSQVAMANEQWQRLMASQPSQGRTILELLRQGHNHSEVAERLGLHPKVVQRLVRKLSEETGLPT